MPKPSKIPLPPSVSPTDTSPASSSQGAPSPSAASPPARRPPAKKGTKATKPVRRSFTAAEKLRIVRAADACTERGQVAALLRHEGVYSSLLASWRKALRLHGEKGVRTRGPGRPRTRDAQADERTRLERENAALRRDVERLRAVVDLQKKLSSLLGMTLEEGAR
jgi:transposase-like protein